MRKVLIADDNPLIRMGLMEMIEWKRLELEPAGWAQDGEEALALCKEIHPDIVITDIRMPRRDGTELLTRLEEDYPEIQTIVVSAYDTFSYVKHAMVTGSLNYILKPIDPAELNATLEKALGEIEKGQRVQRRLPEILLAEMKKEYKEWFGKEPVCLVGGKGYSKERAALCEQTLRNLVCIEQDTIYLAVGIVKGNYDSQPVTEKWSAFLQKEAAGRRLLPAGFTENTWEMACEEVLEDAFIQGFCWKGELVEDVAQISQGNLFPLLDSGNLKPAYQLLTDSLTCCERWERDKCCYNQECIRTCLKLLCQYSDESFDKANEILAKMEESRRTLSYENITEILKDVYALMEAVCLRAAEKLHTQKHIAIQMKKILSENYQEDMSIEKMAELFGYSTVYLSRLFKKETGVSAGQYLIGIRMEKAAELLRKTDMKIIDIAHQVGYEDELYFQKLFKRKTGKSPGAYRKDTG